MDHAGEGLLREGLKPQEVILKDKETRHCKSSCCIDRGGGEDLEDRASGVSTREEKAGMMVRAAGHFSTLHPPPSGAVYSQELSGSGVGCKGKGPGALSFAASGEPLRRTTHRAQGVVRNKCLLCSTTGIWDCLLPTLVCHG